MLDDVRYERGWSVLGHSEQRGMGPVHSIVGALTTSVRIRDLYPERPMRPDARDAK